MWNRWIGRLALAAALAALPARASQFTDMWWDPQESGWGLSVVQQVDTAFVMLYAYGQDGKATWYVASDARILGYVGSLPVFAGWLYRARGPWHGGPFDPSRVELARVGTVELEALSNDRMRLTYSVDGRQVTKEVRRFTWARPELDAHFLATFSLRQARASGAPYGSLMYAADARVALEGDSVHIRVDDQFGRTCHYGGLRTQSGKAATVSGTFSCSAGANGLEPRAGTFGISGFEVNANGFTGYLTTQSASVREYGRFSGTLL